MSVPANCDQMVIVSFISCNNTLAYSTTFFVSLFLTRYQKRLKLEFSVFPTSASTQFAITCLKLTTEALEQCVKYVQS